MNRRQHIVPWVWILVLVLSSVNGYAQIELSGSIEGTLPIDEYLVVDDLWVEAGSTLNLQSGTILRFREGTSFDLYGPLFAEGSPGDSIYFESETVDGSWGGLNYHDFSGYHQTLRYCVITGSNSSGVRTEEIMTLYIKHCRFSYNSATQYGGAIAWNHWESGAIDSCEFSFNEDYAICFYNSGQEVSYSELNIHDNEGGVRILDGPVTLSHCRIADNTSNVDGGGIRNESSGVHILYCLIKGNTATNRGGGIYSSSTTTIENCTIVWNSSGNLGSGIDDNVGSLNCTNNIIANNVGQYGIYSPYISHFDARLNYNIFFNNGERDIWYIPSSETEYGILNQTNVNGDSCDTHFNLFMDPLFANDETNFQLLPDSPCIDAGDPGRPHDPDGTIADIGAFPTGITTIDDPEQNSTSPRNARLLSNYPNPFNMSTTIPFELPETGFVDLVICNPLGQVVTHLVYGVYFAGNYITVWDGRNDAGSLLGSGVYFVLLQTQNYTTTRKIVLVK